jgi:hypothetical protein
MKSRLSSACPYPSKNNVAKQNYVTESYNRETKRVLCFVCKPESRGNAKEQVPSHHLIVNQCARVRRKENEEGSVDGGFLAALPQITRPA